MGYVDALSPITASQEQDTVDRVAKQLYIGGQWRDASGGGTLDVEDPSTGEALCAVADGQVQDAGAALREATEESGITGLQIAARPLHVDVHPVTCSLGVPTRHLDVRYLVRAPAGARPVISDESDDLRWWPVGALPPDSDTVPAMTALARAAPTAGTVVG